MWRAKIVLLSADGVGTNEIMRQTGKSKTCVWRWQERFMVEGFDGLLRDKTRPSRVAPLGADVAERVVTLTQTDPPAVSTVVLATIAVLCHCSRDRGRRSRPCWSQEIGKQK